MPMVRCVRMTVDCSDYGGYDMRDLCMHTCNEQRREALIEGSVVIGKDTTLEMVNENTKEVVHRQTVYTVTCVYVGGNFECRTRTGYLVPLTTGDERGGVHNVNPKPDGYVDCKWNEGDWSWECYDELGSYRLAFSLVIQLAIVTMMTIN